MTSAGISDTGSSGNASPLPDDSSWGFTVAPASIASGSGAETAASPASLSSASAVSAAGLDSVFDEVFSVDKIGAYKTDERVYKMVTNHFRVYPEAVSFQSSNRWDIAGATAFGFRTVWINRGGLADEYGDLPPAATLASLDGLVSL